jgi:hypothetical protein
VVSHLAYPSIPWRPPYLDARCKVSDRGNSGMVGTSRKPVNALELTKLPGSVSCLSRATVSSVLSSL